MKILMTLHVMHKPIGLEIAKRSIALQRHHNNYMYTSQKVHDNVICHHSEIRPTALNHKKVIADLYKCLL